jgi:hypothetical protein
MGQPLFQWPTPDGYPDYAEAWSGTLLTRWRFALALVNSQIPGTEINLSELTSTFTATTPEERLAQWATLLLGRPLPPAAARQLTQRYPLEDDKLMLAVLLGSPAFQWKG